MRTVLAIQMAALLSLSMGSMAATVAYQHPDLTIVAKEEPLHSVLKSLGKEMRIFVTTPSDLNPLVNCDIQDQPIKVAIKNLLGDLSYSLEWDQKSGQLVGLTILGGTGEAAVATAPSKGSQPASVNEINAAVVDSSGNAGSVTPADHGAYSDQAAYVAEQEAPVEIDPEEREAQMAEEREAHYAEMIKQREEQEIEHKAQMEVELERHEAAKQAYLKSQGLNFPQ